MKNHCNQCKTSWKVPEAVLWDDPQWDPKGELPLAQMRILRAKFGASEYDAKSTSLHISWTGGYCHNCPKRIPRGLVACKSCGATNYNFHGPPTLAQRLGVIPNPVMESKRVEQVAASDR